MYSRLVYVHAASENHADGLELDAAALPLRALAPLAGGAGTARPRGCHNNDNNDNNNNNDNMVAYQYD